MRVRHDVSGYEGDAKLGVLYEGELRDRVTFADGSVWHFTRKDFRNTFTSIGAPSDSVFEVTPDWSRIHDGFTAPLPEEYDPSGYVDNNPKTAMGAAKVPLHLVPPSAKHFLAKAFADGAKKYGPYNWRDKKVSSSVYYAALSRHMDAWWDGEEVAEDSKIEHLAHAIACIGILIDAATSGNLIDDRPTVGAASRLQKEYVSKKEESIEQSNSNTVEQCGVSSSEANLCSPSRCC